MPSSRRSILLNRSTLLLAILSSVTLLSARPLHDAAKFGEVNAERSEAIQEAYKFFSPLRTAVDSAVQTVMNSSLPGARWIRHKINRGDTLARIWERYGASRESATLAANALADLGSSASMLRHGDEIELKVAADGAVEGLKKRERDGTVIILEGDSDGGYHTTTVQPEVSEAVRTASGVITSSLVSAAKESEVPYSVVDEYVDLFSSRVEFGKALQPGDSFTVRYVERKDGDGNLLEPGPILAASIKTGGKMMVAIRHQPHQGKAQYFDEEGNALGNYFLRYPLQFTRISAAFSSARFHPVLKIVRPHNGVDFAAPQGTPVRAVADGVIEIAGWAGEGGQEVKIRHSDRWETAYLHLSKINSRLHPGSHISRGEILGAVGMTGLATGPHLHFSLYDRGKYVNPLSTALPQMEIGHPIPKDVLIAALQSIREAHAALERTEVADNSADHYSPRT